MKHNELDTSDLDQWMGKQVWGSESFEPVATNDIRRWVQAMHYPNRLHYDRTYARESRHAGIIAPQSFSITCDSGHGVVPACVGKIPNSHLLFGGDEWWFHGPVIKPGDTVHNERFAVDYNVKNTGFAGPTCFQRGDTHYYNQDGDKIATQRSTSIRYRPDLAREQTALKERAEEPAWSDDDISRLEERKFGWIKMLHDLSLQKRKVSEVVPGDALPERVFGPHSIASFATEWRAYTMNLWGAMKRLDEPEDLGWVEDMAGYEQDGAMELINPELTDGAYYGPSRGHLFARYAQHIGMPRPYGYGASMGAWVLDYLAGWAGQWGYVTYCKTQYRGPALVGDITIMKGQITDLKADEDGRGGLVDIAVTVTNQDAEIMATANGTVLLTAGD